MRVLDQTLAVTALNLRGIPRRAGASLVIVAGIAGVVAVLVAVLAMADGYRQSLLAAGAPDRAIVLRAGATSEYASLIPRETAAVILDAPGIRRDGNVPIASAEPVLSVGVTSLRNGEAADATIRGVGVEFARLRPEMRLVAGRMFRPGTHELIVGRAAAAEFKGVNVGDRLRLRNQGWMITGQFESGRDIHESELIGDADSILDAFRRDGFQSVTVALDSPRALATLNGALSARSDLGVQARSERDYFADRSATLTKFLGFIARVVGGIMAVGALFGAVNTLSAAVAARTREIATLRAIGFRPMPILLSVLAEALMLAVAGGVLGAFAAWLFFNGHAVSTRAGGVSQLVFPLAVTPASVATGIIWALTIGLAGAVVPALRAIRRPIVAGLREA